MPKLIQLYIRQVIIGFILAAIFVGLLLALNVANLRHLIFTSDVGLLAGFLLVFFNGIVFGGVQFAIAIMRMGRDDDDDDRRGLRQHSALPVPIKAAHAPRP